MSCFLYAADCPSPLSSPNPNSISALIPSLCPDFSFEFPAFERDYMGLGLGLKQEIVVKKIPASLATSPLIHKSSLTDPSPINDDLCGSHLKLAPPSGADNDGDADDGEPLSATIGWPPISSYRKSTTRGLSIKPPCSTETITPLIVHEAPLEETTNNNIDDENEAFTIMHMKASLIRKPLHIKVSMDGTPIMRKLDLESMQGYHHLSLELHKLFKFYKRNLSCEVGVHSCFKDLNGASFLLIYKDKDGDWMLVGDTPWETFAQSARRIRIMKKVK